MATKSANKAVVGSKVYSNPRKEVSGNETRDSINLAIDESVNQDEYNANEAARDAEIAALSSSLGDYIPIAQKGVANGVVPTNENNEIPIEYFPAGIGTHNSMDGLQGGTSAYRGHISQSMSENLVNFTPQSIFGNSTSAYKNGEPIQTYGWFFTMLVYPTLAQVKTYLGIEDNEFEPQTYNVGTAGTTNITLPKKFTTLTLNASNPTGGVRRVNIADGGGDICFLQIAISETIALAGYEIAIFNGDSTTRPIAVMKNTELNKPYIYRAVLEKTSGDTWRIFGEKDSLTRGDIAYENIDPKRVIARYSIPYLSNKVDFNLPAGCRLTSVGVFAVSNNGNIILQSIQVDDSVGAGTVVPLTTITEDSIFDVSKYYKNGTTLYFTVTFTDNGDMPTISDYVDIIAEYTENFKTDKKTYE